MKPEIKYRVYGYAILICLTVYGSLVYSRWDGYRRHNIPEQNRGSIWKVWEPPMSKTMQLQDEQFRKDAIEGNMQLAKNL